MPDMLPALYETWVVRVLPGPIPEETQATCQHCAMCPPASNVPGEMTPLLSFNPQTKCCTYLPRIPNFLVGSILADETPEMKPGRATVEQRILQNIAVTPFGLEKTRLFHLLYREGGEATFGRSRALRCPHYLEEGGGLCGIWRYREATCVTWFCKYERGAVGRNFWEMLRQLLHFLEESLARWCIHQLEIGGEALHALFAYVAKPPLERDQLDGIADPARQRLLWGKWSGHEQEFYRESAALVNALSWEDICAICGPELPIWLQLTREAYSSLLDRTLPQALSVRRPLQMLHRGQRHSQLTSYNGSDPLQLPNVLMDAFPYFDGRPLEEALQAIAHEKHLVLDETLLRKLVDFEILVAPPKPRE